MQAMTMRHEWLVDGAITCNGSRHPGPVSIFHGSAETWLSPQGFHYQSLSLNCIDRRLLLGDARTDDRGAPANAHHIEATGGRDGVGYHILTVGHPADDERVIRHIPGVQASARYARDSLALSIEAVTLEGMLSRTDNFSADQSPWAIHIELVVPRADVRDVLRLSDEDAARIEPRFKPA